MNKKQLKERLNELLERGEQFDYESLSTDEWGYVTEVSQEWPAWLQRVTSIIESNFKEGSLPFIKAQAGRKEAQEIVGNRRRVFDSAKNTLLQAIREALQICENDLYQEIRDHLSSPASLPKAEDNPIDIFISHSSKDANVAEALIELLQVALNIP